MSFRRSGSSPRAAQYFLFLYSQEKSFCSAGRQQNAATGKTPRHDKPPEKRLVFTDFHAEERDFELLKNPFRLIFFYNIKNMKQSKT